MLDDKAGRASRADMHCHFSPKIIWMRCFGEFIAYLFVAVEATVCDVATEAIRFKMKFAHRGSVKVTFTTPSAA